MGALKNREVICEQLTGVLSSVDKAQVERLEALILGAKKVFCSGMGRSGLSSRGFAMRLMHLGIPCSIVGDTLCRPIAEGDLLVITSASGGSGILSAAADKAHALGAKTAVITGNASARLSETADACVIIKAPSKEDMGEERASVLPMGSLFEEASYVLYDMVISDLMEALGIGNDQMVTRHANLE